MFDRLLGFVCRLMEADTTRWVVRLIDGIADGVQVMVACITLLHFGLRIFLEILVRRLLLDGVVVLVWGLPMVLV
ncbi:MAG: hypothetical protein DRJ03_00630 [Chloroflexi bacterium]|nr:MAG: hypothetical protein DRJ03_00630 [Chloroflexota bacterium]